MTKKILFILTLIVLVNVNLLRAEEAVKGTPHFKFAYLSDTHIANDAQSVYDLEACIADINDNKEIKFVIFAGDITEFGSDKEILLAKSLIDKLNKPYYIVAGNHDAKWSESGCNTFAKVFGYEHFEFDFDGIKFVGTNSGPNMRMAPALLPRESMVWIDSLTKSINTSQPLFFINHYPMDSSMLNYFQVLNKLKKVNTQLILNGHWHSNRAMDYEGIPGVIGRSTMRTGRDGSGYNIISVDGSTVTFSERIVSQVFISDGKTEIRTNGRSRIYPAGDKVAVKAETKSSWHTLRLSRGLPFDSSVQYRHPDYSINSQYPKVKELWRVEDRSDIASGAVLSGNFVVYANTSGEVYALNAQNGDRVWRYVAGGKIFSTPAVSNGVVVFGCADGIITALNLRSGKKVWQFHCDKSVLGSPAIFAGKVYIGASDNRFRALDLKTGKLIWNYDEIKGFIEAKPFVDSRQVVIGDWANMLYSFNPQNGKLQWSWTNGKGRMLSPAAVWPVKANGKILFVTPERTVYAVGAETGYQIWSAKGGRESQGLSPDGNELYIKSMNDTLIAFNTRGTLPAKVWVSKPNFGYEIAPSPITSVGGVGKEGKGLLFIPTDKGNIIAVNCVDGSVVWRHRVSFALINYIEPVGKNKILVSAMDGIVSMIEY